MVWLYTAAEMRRADGLAVEAGVPSLVLMENAGRAVARLAAELVARFSPAPGSTGIIILCGKGNNGGDGLVAARYLAEAGYPVEVVLASEATALSGDARHNLETLRGAGSIVLSVFGEEEVGGSAGEPAERFARLDRAALIIDALLGTGARGAAHPPVSDLITWLNPRIRSSAPSDSPRRPLILSVDVPSGLNADTGRPEGAAVRADATVTLGAVKVGLAMPWARPYTGRLYLAPIGLPDGVLDAATAAGTARTGWLLPDRAARHLPERPVDGHKGTFGHVRVMAGSRGFSGAAVLAALGALRAGAGLVTVLCPRGCRDVVAAALPEALTHGLAEDADGRLDPGATSALAERLFSAGGAVVVGPGLGVGRGVEAAVGQLLRDRPIPMVLDADALNALACRGPEAAGADLVAAAARRPPGLGPLVLTPHPGEMARLTGRPAAEIQEDRLGAALRAARAWRAVVVLKGAGTVVAGPDQDTGAGGALWVNATGNPGMATAGSGDVLAGVIGAYLAQGVPPLEAAMAAVAVHGLAGDQAARSVGDRGLLASDIAHRLPRAAQLLSTVDGYAPILVES